MTDAEARPALVTSEDFRAVMSRFATGVVIVTCVQDGFDHAMTANSFSSVSLSPAMVLFCVENDSRFHEAVTDTLQWSVSIMDEFQRGRARWFATRGRPLIGQFDSTPTHRSAVSGALLFDDALATLDCRTSAIHVAGDHDIVVGDVLDIRTLKPEGDPLVYFGSRFRTLGEDSPTSG